MPKTQTPSRAKRGGAKTARPDKSATPLGSAEVIPMTDIEIIHQRLLAPFPASEMEVRPGASGSGGKAKPLFYVDPRAYTKRLNQVFGLEGWSDRVTHITFGEDTAERTEWNSEKRQREVVGTKEGLLVGMAVEIQVHTSNLTKTVTDVGEKGVEAAAENKLTSAHAQAFKRAASRLGVGAYLYYIAMDAQPYDRNNGFPFTSPPDDLMESALRDVGFKGQCEVTGKKVRWKVAAYSMHLFGQVLCEGEIERRKADQEA